MGMLPEVGSEFAGYRIEAVIGRGGMAVVFRAEHLQLARKVAIKILSPEISEDKRFRQRFIRESRLAASIDHPNIVPIYDAAEAEDFLYIAMRYVERNLKDLLQEEGRLSPEGVFSVGAQVANALDAAHSLDLVHRDVKPANVLIARSSREPFNHAYLSDFGLTKHASSRSGLTGTGQFVGTIDYIAPEQIEAKEVDSRTDVYALGCLLFECLTGEIPYPRESDAAILWAHLQEDPPMASSRRDDCPRALDQVLVKAMAKSRENRQSSCGELLDDFGRELDGHVVPPLRSRETVLGRPPPEAAAANHSQSPPSVPVEPLQGPPMVLPGEVPPPAPFPPFAEPAEGRTAAKEPPRSRATVTAAVLVAGIVLALAGWGLVSIRNGDGSRIVSPESATDAGVRRAPLLEEVQLLSHLPADVRSECEPLQGLPRDQPTGVHCSFGEGEPVEIVEYRFFHDGAAMRRWYEGEMEGGEVQAGAGDCSATNGVRPGTGEGAWYSDSRDGSHAVSDGSGERPEGISFRGRVLCFTEEVAGTRSHLIWTDSATKLAARATTSSLDYPELFEWWSNDAGPVHHEQYRGDITELGEGSWPNDLEQRQIVLHLPRDLIEHCMRVQSAAPALTGAHCTPPDSVTRDVKYLYFYDTASMREWFEEKEKGGDCGHPFDSTQRWFDRGREGVHTIGRDYPFEAKGWLFCYHNSADEAVVEWFDFSTRLYGIATAHNAHDAELREWWMEGAGPVHPAHSESGEHANGNGAGGEEPGHGS